MALLKISPIFVIVALLLKGVDVKVAASIAAVYGAFIVAFVDKRSYNDIVNKVVESVSTIILVFFILMFAYAMAESFMATGVGAAIIRLALRLGVTGKLVAVVAFVTTCALSVATGTSWGTFAACAPVFLWLNHITGGNFALTTAALAGGSCFGDNIGLISDTTIVSCGVQNVEVIDRVRYQGVWSLLCLVLSALLFFVVGISMGLPDQPSLASEAIAQIPPEAWTTLEAERPSAVMLLKQVSEGVPNYMILPFIIVLITAFKGVPTLLCLGLGIVSSLIMGLIIGSTSLMGFFDLLYIGYSDAGSASVAMMLWVTAFGGIMNMMNAFEPFSKFILRISKSVRQLLFYNGVFCIIGNTLLADEMAQIVTIGPIIKEMTDNNVEASEEDMYKIRLRNATLSDAMACFSALLIPWHCYVVFFRGIANSVYPLYTFGFSDIAKYNFMAYIAIISLLILTLTGFDKFIPLFHLPSEPEVKLRKSNASI